MKPKDVSSELVRIASGIEASMEPSASAVAGDLRRVLAALAGEVVMTGASHGEFEEEKRADDVWSCTVTYSGTAAGSPFTLSGRVSIRATTEVEADEDGMHSSDDISEPEFEEAVSAEVGGAPVDPNEDVVSDIILSAPFKSYDLAYMKKVRDEFESDVWPDAKADRADSEAYRRDPYSYYGVKRSDFM